MRSAGGRFYPALSINGTVLREQPVRFIPTLQPLASLYENPACHPAAAVSQRMIVPPFQCFNGDPLGFRRH
jgi:hypothetical protein